MAAPCSFAPEFPNDNPSLHKGVIWRCEEVCSRPKAIIERVAPEVVAMFEAMDNESTTFEVVDSFENEDSDFVLDEDHAPSGSFDLGTPNEVSEAANENDDVLGHDDLSRFVRVLAEILVAKGATATAPMVAQLLSDSCAEASDWPGINLESFVDDRFRNTARGWLAILRGESHELAGDGRMLDEWAADLLSRLLGAEGRSEQIRRELRSRGVAAFGMVPG